jgi:hypothetical protein
LLGSAFAQEINTHPALVRKLDAMRLPPEDFTARLTIRKTQAGASSAAESRYRQYSRRRVESGGRIVLDTLAICIAPARDAGKMVLFVGDACWFYDPHAKRATRVPPQQVAAQALVADLANWRFAEDFDHRFAGKETVDIAGKPRPCTVLDLTPKPGAKNRSALVRCWIDAAGRPWKEEHYTASKQLFRTVLFTKYEPMLGAERAVAVSVENHGAVEEVKLSDVNPAVSPAEYFNPDKLPAIAMNLRPRD